MDAKDLRIALFSGNYNYVRDGANQALNRLMGYALKVGANVRIYSPTTDSPAFTPEGELISVRSFPIPGRGEYRVAFGIPRAIRRNIAAFSPNVIHVSAPDILGHRAVSYARSHNVPLISSMHTRFETYPAYYGLGFLEHPLRAMLRRFYDRADLVLAPSEPVRDLMREDRMGHNFSIWSRGVDTSIFNPDQRSLAWRRSLGIGDDEMVIGYLGRLVLEKGIADFAATVRALKTQGVAHRVLVIGDGPARAAFDDFLPDAVFIGFQRGADLGRAVASLDILLNPSTTEAFGNVMLETMACGVPVVAARAMGGTSLITEGENGVLVEAGDVPNYIKAVQDYAVDPDRRKRHGNAALVASKAYEWDRINQTVIDNYIKLASRSAPRA
jgi:phosphatidylinositol alpha 1,6-mannosyltransferase